MPKYRRSRKKETPAVAPSVAVTHSTLTWRGSRPVVGEWVRMFVPNLRALALEDWPVKTDWRVLMLCCTSIAQNSKDNRILLSQAEMAHLLKITPSACSNAMKRLRQAGLVFKRGQRIFINSRLASDAERILDLARLRREEAKALKDMGFLGE